jgi:hypothetical protein
MGEVTGGVNVTHTVYTACESTRGPGIEGMVQVVSTLSAHLISFDSEVDRKPEP